jgi:hypothetical protein
MDGSIELRVELSIRTTSAQPINCRWRMSKDVKFKRVLAVLDGHYQVFGDEMDNTA